MGITLFRVIFGVNLDLGPTGRHDNISFIIKTAYFKNTSYVLVKIAHRFSLENSQNLRDPRGIAPGVLPQYITCATPDLGSPDE